jgi:pyruvate kinase
MEFALGLGVDYIAISFGQTAQDAIDAKTLIAGRARLIYKVETRAACQNIDPIIDASDAIMVARGDLGVEVGPENLFAVQDELIRRANHAQKPAILATEVFESMTTAMRPSRPESAGIGRNIGRQNMEENVGIVMLSGETATGAHPVHVIKTLVDHIKVAEV